MTRREATAFHLEIAGIVVEVRRKSVKNLTLRINATGQIKLSAPLRLSQTTIQTFLNQKEHWITTHLARLRTRPLSPVSSLNHSAMISLFDNQVCLHLHAHHRLHYIYEQNILHCYLPDVHHLAAKQRLLQQWYLEQMQPVLTRLLQHWQSIIGVNISHCSIRSMKTRWGSCQPATQRITINLQLVHYPLVCLEYVVVHELVHLLEASHNRRFYTLMTQFMPNWRQYKAMLQNKL